MPINIRQARNHVRTQRCTHSARDADREFHRRVRELSIDQECRVASSILELNRQSCESKEWMTIHNRVSHQTSRHRCNGCALAEAKYAIERRCLARKEVPDVHERILQAVEISVFLVGGEAPRAAFLLRSVIRDISGILGRGCAIGSAARMEDVEGIDRNW